MCCTIFTNYNYIILFSMTENGNVTKNGSVDSSIFEVYKIKNKFNVFISHNGHNDHSDNVAVLKCIIL